MDSESERGPAFRLGGEIQNVTFGAWSRALRTGDQFKRNTRAAPQPPLTQQGEQAALYRIPHLLCVSGSIQEEFKHLQLGRGSNSVRFCRLEECHQSQSTSESLLPLGCSLLLRVNDAARSGQRFELLGWGGGGGPTRVDYHRMKPQHKLCIDESQPK